MGGLFTLQKEGLTRIRSFFMKIRDIMETVVVTVPVHATYRDVAHVLYHQEQHCVVVVDAEGRPVGIISEYDLFRILYPHYGSYYLNAELYTDPAERERKIEEVQAHPVERFMQKDIHHTSPDEPVMRVGATMLAKNLRRLPVLEDGKLVGIVTRPAIFRALYETHLRDVGGSTEGPDSMA